MGSSAASGVMAVQKKIDDLRREGKTPVEILTEIEKEIAEIIEADQAGWF